MEAAGVNRLQQFVVLIKQLTFLENLTGYINWLYKILAVSFTSGLGLGLGLGINNLKRCPGVLFNLTSYNIHTV